MKMLSGPEIKNMLARLYWDVKVQPDQLHELLKGNIERIGHVDILNLYYRMLITYDWYTILRIVPPDKLGDLLSDAVLDKIRFKDLKEKFLYARQIVLQGGDQIARHQGTKKQSNRSRVRDSRKI